ncbi:MAG: carboxypeptidase-like regulatory domain-containing protein, partial [Deltaproteobacteria bacterium]|nr:carboxypeptidase-like regulatory domain-containing protein [Deltaproteobacteria bacterium]
MRRAVPFAAVAALLAVGVWLLSRSPAQEDRLPTQATAASDSSRSAPTRPRAAPASSRAAAGAPFKTELTRAEVEDSDVANGAFAGTVINWGDGKPVAGAELAFEGQAGLETVSSGADGSFLFTPSGKGRYRLALVSKEGFLPYAPALGRSPIEAVPRPRTLVRGMRVYLSPAIDYRGRVVDADGEPIAAEIRLLGADTGEQVLSPIRDRFSAGDDGRFGFHAPDGAMLEARTADGRIGRGAIDGKVQVTHELVIVVTSNPGLGAARISGRVIGEDGQPIPGATVTCNAAGTMGMAFQALTTVRSGDDGRFELTADDSPRIQLRVEADGFVRKLLLVESMRQQVQVVLERGNQVAGTVS